jgi:methyl-accepting chemotaxis protein
MAAKARKPSTTSTSWTQAVAQTQCMIEFAPDGVIRKANAPFTAFVGGEVVGKPFAAVFEASVFEHLVKGSPLSGVHRVARPDGAIAWLAGTFTPVRVKNRLTGFVAVGFDAAPQKAERDELARQAWHLKGAMKGASTNLMMADLNFNIVSMNDTLIEMLKKNEAAIQKDLPNMRVDTLIGGSIDRFHRNPSHQRRMLEGLTGTHTVRMTLGGRNFSLTACACRDAKGVLVGYSVEWQDVTDLNDANGRLSAVYRAQAVIEFDLTGHVLTANQNFLDVLGYTLDEIKGKHHSMFCTPGTAAKPEYAAFWQKLGRGEFDDGVYERLDKQGKSHWIQATYNPVLSPDGKVTKFVKFATDITRQRNFDSENESKMQAISKTQAVIEFSLDGRILWANENFCTTLGYSLEELKGQHHRVLCDPSYTATPEYAAFWSKLNRGEFDSNLYRRIGKGGKDVWIQASYNPILDSSGIPVKVIKFATDVTSTQQLVIDTDRVLRGACEGHLGARVSMAGLEGSLKSLATSINTLLDSLNATASQTEGVVSGANEGDLAQRLPSGGALGTLAASINTLLDSISGMVERIQSATSSMQSATSDIAQGNNNLSQRTQEQSSSLEETASSLEEMTGSVKQNANNATQANQLAASARSAAEKGGAVVEAAVGAMSAITDSSKKVADIIGVIEQLAFQTNMLALNAAVEAARAGDQGRGFAVVAAEVRNLAQRSSGAAKEIKVLLQTSADRVSQGSTLVNDSGTALKDIVLGVKKVSDIIAEINVASDEQANGIGQINQAVMSMDKMTQQNAALVEESATAAAALSEQARAMADLVGFYRTKGSAQTTPARGVVEPALEAHAKPATSTARKQPAARAPGAPATTAPDAPAKAPKAPNGENVWENF